MHILPGYHSVIRNEQLFFALRQGEVGTIETKSLCRKCAAIIPKTEEDHRRAKIELKKAQRLTEKCIEATFLCTHKGGNCRAKNTMRQSLYTHIWRVIDQHLHESAHTITCLEKFCVACVLFFRACSTS